MSATDRDTTDGENTREEQVVLVDTSGEPVGTAAKDRVHRTLEEGGTALHLAFSCHVYRTDGAVLLTRRALSKRAFPGVWTNAVCGHPEPGEELRAAVRRRVRQELGLDLVGVEDLLPDFRYRAADAAGVEENEICPVFVALADADPSPAPDEVSEWVWADPAAVATAVAATPFAYSPWIVEQYAQGAGQRARSWWDSLASSGTGHVAGLN